MAFSRGPRGTRVVCRRPAARLPVDRPRRHADVRQPRRTPNHRWQLIVDGRANPESFDAVILATPAHPTAEPWAAGRGTGPRTGGHRIVRRNDPRAGLPAAAGPAPAGRLWSRVPLAEKRTRLRSVFRASSSTAERRREACSSAFLSAVLASRNRPSSRSVTAADCREELRESLGVQGEPQVCEIFRWPATMHGPEYHVAHLDRVAGIEQRPALLPNFSPAGTPHLAGVGIPFCIHSGEKAAETILHQRSAARTPHAPRKASHASVLAAFPSRLTMRSVMKYGVSPMGWPRDRSASLNVTPHAPRFNRVLLLPGTRESPALGVQFWIGGCRRSTGPLLLLASVLGRAKFFGTTHATSQALCPPGALSQGTRGLCTATRPPLFATPASTGAEPGGSHRSVLVQVVQKPRFHRDKLAGGNCPGSREVLRARA